MCAPRRCQPGLGRPGRPVGYLPAPGRAGSLAEARALRFGPNGTRSRDTPPRRPPLPPLGLSRPPGAAGPGATAAPQRGGSRAGPGRAARSRGPGRGQPRLLSARTGYHGPCPDAGPGGRAGSERRGARCSAASAARSAGAALARRARRRASRWPAARERAARSRACRRWRDRAAERPRRGSGAEARPAAPSGGRGLRDPRSPRPHGEALRRRRRTRSPSLSAALPSKIHLRKMKAHANVWRLLACAFNHGKLTRVPRGPPKMHTARPAPRRSWNSQRAALTRTRRLPRGFLALLGSAPRRPASSAVFLPKSCRAGNSAQR